jgi:mannan endo-1,4-beta-mannosidase
MFKNIAFASVSLLILCCNITMGQSVFIKVKHQQFIIHNKPYYYIGANYWYGGLLALEKDPARGKERLCRELDFLKAHGINNLRVLAGSEGLGMINGVDRVKPSLQPLHGKYNNNILIGLDYLLYQMAKRKMYAVLYLSNNWEWSGGFLQYLNWNNLLADSSMRQKMSWDEQRDNVSKFYSCQPCMMDYRRQVSYIIKHVNKYNHRAYINEPAIMSWELANEPRPMRPTAIESYFKWTDETAVFIKRLDKNHLITLGTEGAMGTENTDVFKQAHSPKQIDYLTIHIWPKNWGWFQDTSISKSLPNVISHTLDYIHRHEAIAAQLDKPLVLEEFGLPRDKQLYALGTPTVSRDKYFDIIFDQLKISRAKGGNIGGCNIWAYSGIALPKMGQVFWRDGDDFMGDPPQEEQGLNSIFNTDSSSWNIIKKYTAELKNNISGYKSK